MTETLWCHKVPVVEGPDDEPVGYTVVGITPYLCPHCPRVHFDIQMSDQVLFAVRLEPEDAERLGLMLLNPPAHPLDNDA
jgi:hypothetical protein